MTSIVPLISQWCVCVACSEDSLQILFPTQDPFRSSVNVPSRNSSRFHGTLVVC